MPQIPESNVTEFLPLRPSVLCLLGALAQGHQHGYAIMKAVEETSRGSVRIGPGTLYGALQRLTRSGLVEEVEERPQTGDDPRRRYYCLTDFGQTVLSAEAERLRVLLGDPRLSVEDLVPARTESTS